MRKEEFKQKKDALVKEMEAKKEAIKKLEQSYLDGLIEDSGLCIGGQVEASHYRGEIQKCWITGFRISYDLDLNVTLNKVKKNGDNGNASFDSYGRSIKHITVID